MTAPEVAVIIPCFNHGEYVEEAVESARSQDRPGVECVVVDDGSTDRHTIAVLDKLPVRVIRQANRGLPAARNTGVRATDTPYFVCLDADDRIAPQFVSALLPRLLDDDALGYCYSWTRYFGARTGRWACPEYDARRLLVENLSTATAVVRRAAFDGVGGYAEEMVHGFEDWDLWLAFLAAGHRGVCVARELFFYRRHELGMSMLDRVADHRRDNIRLFIDHHRALFVSQLGASGDDDAEILRLLAIESELSGIEHARSWRMLRRFGPALNGSSENRLARIKDSRRYRLIQAVKRMPFFGLYNAWAHDRNQV